MRICENYELRRVYKARYSNENFLYSEIADEEVTHLFATSDDDQDDLLSFEEIIANYDTFVGSEATDYGDHLHNIHHFADEL